MEPMESVESQSKFAFVADIIKTLIISAAIVIPIRVWIAQPFLVRGASMEPSFTSGEYLIIDEISARFSSFERYDVVVFRSPQDPKRFLIKRILGLPGETVEIRDGKVFVSMEGNAGNLAINEPYLSADTYTAPNVRYSLDKDEYFVMGDNREVSFDSRSWGPLERRAITGQVLVRLWPLGKMGLVRDYDEEEN